MVVRHRRHTPTALFISIGILGWSSVLSRPSRRGFVLFIFVCADGGAPMGGPTIGNMRQGLGGQMITNKPNNDPERVARTIHISGVDGQVRAASRRPVSHGNRLYAHMRTPIPMRFNAGTAQTFSTR